MMTVRGWMGELSAKGKRCPEDKKDQGAKGAIPAALLIVDPDHPSTILMNQTPSIYRPCTYNHYVIRRRYDYKERNKVIPLSIIV